MPNDTIWLKPDKSSYLILPDSGSAPSEQEIHNIIATLDQHRKPEEPGSDVYSELSIAILGPAFIFMIAWVIMRASNKLSKNLTGSSQDEEENSQHTPSPYLLYYGHELDFPDDALATMLSKHFPYYNKLSMPGQTKFIARLKRFIAAKNFKIYDESGFKEMPVLISASAVQLGFGLDHYMLASFTDIHIFPDAFLGLEPTIRFLEGNVSGDDIHVSWKHFLNGYRFPDNGENLGLHEMAHAYHIEYFSGQNHICIAEFGWYEKVAAGIFERENQLPTGLYQAYYLRNMEEFWAGSIELFFERPEHLKASYSSLYDAICNVLKQDPAS